MPNDNNNKIFKDWVPTWLVFFSLFLFLVPIAAALGIYMGGMSTASSYYGVDTIDIRYSVVIYYLAIVVSFPLEARFSGNFTSKPYLIGCVAVSIFINGILYVSHSFALLLVMRFVAGTISLGSIGIVFTLVFSQFHEQRSRVLGYATMYATLFGSAPLSYLLDAWLFSNFNFNSVFLFGVFGALPGLILLCVILRNDIDLRRNGKTSLKSLDWASYVLYASAMLTLAYFILYGQYYQWLQSRRMVFCLGAALVLLVLFLIRQLILKTPFIDLRVFKSRNFRIGMGLLVLFYLGKGDMSLLSGFISNSVNLDVYHYGYVMLINFVGIVVGVFLAARYLLEGMRIRIIWMMGFGALLGYHLFSLSIINTQAEISDLLLPLFLQGLGNGMLIISIVLFYVTAVPPEIGFSASVTGVAFRACTFTSAMALTNASGLYFRKIHQQSFSSSITQADPLLADRLTQYKQALLEGGASIPESRSGAMRLLGKTVANQNNLLFIKDYFFYMSCLLILVLIAIATIPHFSYHIKKIKTKLIPV
ncbi:MFS transporter [Mangrovibacterium lignilyticum]|uniref:MFS transporter n=1 Tax=Mangrovibacterium lignilyticum TaxID=2668052 RepID=UPI0013D06286|nr:MFS transporter [Mangrovibacterium lignilyticum]